jgi:AcrR family transcriptional regulator
MAIFEKIKTMSDIASAGEASSPPPKRSRGRPRSDANVTDVVLALIDEVGVRAVTMEAIAERAGISKITLYRKWPNRAGLLAEALLARIRATLPLDAEGDPLRSIQNHTILFGQELSGSTGDLLRALISEFLGNPGMMLEFRDHYLGGRRDIAIGLIRRGIAEGRFQATGRPETLHDSLYGAIFYRFLFCFGKLGKADMRRLVDTILEPVR